MTWELTADVVPSGAPAEVAGALAGWFAEHTARVYVRARRGDGYDAPKVYEEARDGRPDPAWVTEVVAANAAPDRLVEVWVTLREDPDNTYHPSPKVFVYGDALLGVGRVRRRAPVLVTFGNRNAWRGAQRLASGVALTDGDVRDALLHVCDAVRPVSVDLLCEEEADLAFNRHFLFRHRASGFLQDLRDIAQISLRGGGAFHDGRATYEAIVDHPSTMLLGKRSGPYRDRFVAFLDTKLRRLDAQGLPADLRKAVVEEAVLAAEPGGMQAMGDGFAIWNEPLFGGYTDLIYLELVEQLLGERVA